ncbi:MAG TPA: thiamine-phosphate kinase [Acidimicrobiales bacterium]|jgi:thiamine-monophosphate kinase|nr:thiamine-phosphate kinase [Acidimicrobiales bacterium]
MLERIRTVLGEGILAVGLRDDAAVVEVPGGGTLIVSVDSVVEGVHVDLAFCRPADVGWKALMGALSDLAAMGAHPLGALVALCVPPADGDGHTTVEVMEGVAEASAASSCAVVGGDVSSGGQLVVAVTVLGTVDGGIAIPRSGAVPGDVVLVTGPCGGSAAGLRLLRAGTGEGWPYRRPVARLREGALARASGAHAMIDVSDGLALDLHRLADASGVGFVLSEVPVAEGATIEEALGGGEDYELVVTMEAGAATAFERGCRDAGLRTPVRLGMVVADPTERSLGGGALPQLGWQHRLG